MLDVFLQDTNFLNIYPFGSRVYGTATSKSDFDYICIVESKSDSLYTDKLGNHYHLFTPSEFQYLLNICDIQALECYSLPEFLKIKETHSFKLQEIDKHKLRESISTITSNSWVKGKKKLIVTGDYDKYLGMKSVFHSLRILDFGIQLARYGSIINYKSSNFIWIEVQKLAEQYDRNELWDAIDTKYRKLFNSLGTEFKIHCPKNLNDRDKKMKLKKLLSDYNVYSKELYDEIIILI
jgi:hypothetical protein